MGFQRTHIEWVNKEKFSIFWTNKDKCQLMIMQPWENSPKDCWLSLVCTPQHSSFSTHLRGPCTPKAPRSWKVQKTISHEVREGLPGALTMRILNPVKRLQWYFKLCSDGNKYNQNQIKMPYITPSHKFEMSRNGKSIQSRWIAAWDWEWEQRFLENGNEGSYCGDECFKFVLMFQCSKLD